MDSVTGTSVSIFTVAFHVHLALYMNHTPPNMELMGKAGLRWIGEYLLLTTTEADLRKIQLS